MNQLLIINSQFITYHANTINSFETMDTNWIVIGRYWIVSDGIGWHLATCTRKCGRHLPQKSLRSTSLRLRSLRNYRGSSLEIWRVKGGEYKRKHK